VDDDLQHQAGFNELHQLALTLDPALTISRDLCANLADGGETVGTIVAAVIEIEALIRFGQEDGRPALG
jgi:hypothetical protein